ncbi:serine/threonine-protein kinase [Streptomyces sp. NPDC058045]|uniref:serine/threonine-protein kinase n=1 Tax=Streptomyces sp. NPDC058045 TaxID=3346311 RepID=UPI0036EFB4C0
MDSERGKRAVVDGPGSGAEEAAGAGRKIGGRYRLIRRLGAGGMGRVWYAHDEELSCEVSMKEIAVPGQGEARPSPELVARARSEARNAARLRAHPNVVTVHDVIEDDGLPWIVMEFVPDVVDLQELIDRSGPLTVERTARVGLAVLDALSTGHRIGILHRDVKPANILLAPDISGDPYGRVLLTDYGIALRPGSRDPRLTPVAGVIGTPGFLAPERIHGDPPTPAADLFSMGATLYTAVEGRGPFEPGEDGAARVSMVLDAPVPPRRAGELGPVLLGLLEKDPMRRAAPETVRDSLRELLAQDGPAPNPAPTGGSAATPDTQGEAPPPPAEPPTTPPSATPDSAPEGDPRRRWRLVAAAVAAVAVLAGAVVWAVTAFGGGGHHHDDAKKPTPAHSSPVGSAPARTSQPYGEQVGLDAELRPGDCLSAVWSGKKLHSTPRLSLLNCDKEWPDAQVVTVLEARSLDAARKDSKSRCATELDGLVRGLADLTPYALVPTEAGWTSKTQRYACVAFAKSDNGVSGPLGRFRDTGDTVYPGNTSIDDCFDVSEDKDKKGTYSWILADCDKSHAHQVIGFVSVPEDMSFRKASDNEYKLCAQKYAAAWEHGGHELYGWTNKSAFGDGYHFVTCTVSDADTKLPPGRISAGH